MKTLFITIISYILIFFNSNLLSDENNNTLKIGLLAPFSGEYKDLGESLLYSLQLALSEINDKKVFVIPRDSGSNNKEKLIRAVEEIRSEGANIIIGPINNNDFNEVKSIVNELLNDPILLQSTSEGAVKLAQKFDWRNIILDWEKVIVDLQNGK